MLFHITFYLPIVLLVARTLASPLSDALSAGQGHGQVFRRQTATNSSLTPQQLLALNIGVNMMSQQGQIAAVETIQQMQQAGLTGTQAFNATKGSLMTLISSSIQIRADSQKLATAQEAVAPGLAQLEESQVQGYFLANQLSGDPATDTPNLQRLKEAFQGDLAMNQALQAKATGGSATSTSSPPAVATKQ